MISKKYNSKDKLRYFSDKEFLMDIIEPDAENLIENSIIMSMSVIDWGKAMARCNEIIQKDLLKFCGFSI